MFEVIFSYKIYCYRSNRPGKRPKPALDKRRLRIIEGKYYLKKLNSLEIFALHSKCDVLDISVFNNIVNNSLQVTISLFNNTFKSASNWGEFKDLDLWSTPIPYQELMDFAKDRGFKKIPPPDYVQKPE